MKASLKGVSRTPYECGFQGVGSIRLPFTVHFYFPLLVFLVFDLEIVFLLGFLVSGILWLFFFFFFLIYSTFYVERFLGGLV